MTKKRIETELPVTIFTGYTHESGDETERARQQIEKIGFYFQALFNSIRVQARFYEGEAESCSHELAVFCGGLIEFADIGNGLADALFRTAADLPESPTKETEQNEIEKPIIPDAKSEVEINEAIEKVELASRQTAEIASLALQLSAVLNNQNLPVEIYNSVMDTVGEIYNKGDNEMLNRFESSPEYLKALLLAYAKREVSH